LSGERLDAWFITDWRSESVLDHVTAMADKLLPTNDPWSNSLLKSIEEANNELWLDIFIKRGMDINKKRRARLVAASFRAGRRTRYSCEQVTRRRR
jgi:hypothetical protein